MLHAIEALQLPLGEAISIQTQHETFYIQRQPQQWQLSRIPLEHPVCALYHELDIVYPVRVPLDAEVVQRWNSGEQESTLRIVPAMADRNLVVHLGQPVLVPGGRRPKFYLSLPLMYQLYIGNGKQPFYEFFIEKLPLTWFGSNTRRGELCYQFLSNIEHEISSGVQVPHRAMLELRLCNRDSEHLSVDKINLPAPYLPVYRVDGKVFWTTALTITNEKLTDALSLHYGKTVPCRHDLLQLVSEPRLRSEARTILRALEAIIG